MNQPAVPASVPSAALAASMVTPPPDDGNRLIDFNRRVIAFCALIVLLFIFFVAFAIHGSAIGYWDQVMPGRAEQGFTLGEPKQIRSDDWLVYTPFSLSQFQQGFPTRNPSLGAHDDPLALGVPVKDFSTVFRPQTWGWLTLGRDRGYAFWWDLKIAGLALSSFLLLLVLTRNRFWLSVLGTAWIFFSSFIQWWFSTNMVELITAFNIIFLALLYVFLDDRRWVIGLATGLLAFAGAWFGLVLYPPFQVPFIYLLVALAVGFFLQPERRRLVRENLVRRGALVLGAGVFVAVVFLLFYLEARETIAAVQATVYPGHRMAGGGELDLLHLFAGFTLSPWHFHSYSQIFANASEASNFILFFPAVLISAVAAYVTRRKLDSMQVALLAFLLLMSVWALVGLPGFLARLTLLSLVTPSRLLLGIGYASLLLTMYFLGKSREETPRLVAAAGAVAMLALLLLLSWRYKAVDPNYYRYSSLLVMSAGFAVLTYFLLARRRIAFAAGILLALIPAYTVNPLSAGMGPLVDNPVFQAADAIRVKDPEARWVAYGDVFLPNLLIATGVPVVDGYKYTPDLDFFRNFDPHGSAVDLYNRYAIVTFLPMDPGQRRPLFDVYAQDGFRVKADPCGAEMMGAGIDYYAFAGPTPAAEKMSCLVKLQEFPQSGVSFYAKRRPGIVTGP